VECPPVGRGGAAFDDHDFGDAARGIQFCGPFREFPLARRSVRNDRIHFGANVRFDNLARRASR
jgi:hypothetical protein